MKKIKILSIVLLVMVIMFGTVSYSSYRRCTHDKWGATVKIEVKQTCTKEGISRKRCKNCGTVLAEFKLKKLGHSVSKTWSSDSSRHYKVCTRCKAQVNTSSHSEQWKYTSTQHYKACKVCKYRTSISSAHSFDSKGKCKCGYVKASLVVSTPQDTSCSHKFDNYTKTKATCVLDGLMQRVCTKCGYVISETVVPKLDHNWKSISRDVKKVGSEKVCTTTTEKFECTRCDAAKGNSSADTLHNFRNATCTEAKKCKDCDYKYGSPLDHNYVWVTFNKMKCTACGNQKECKHNWEMRIKVLPTCFDYGRKERVCTDCGYVFDTEFIIPKLIHNDNGVCVNCLNAGICQHLNKVEPKCTINGKCKDCGEILTSLGHAPGKYQHTETEHYQECIRCGFILSNASHVIGNFKDVKKANCKNEGERIGKCQCGYEVTEKVPSNNEHVFSAEAGYSSDRNGHYLHCKYCDAVSSECVAHDIAKGTCNTCGWFCKTHEYFYDSEKRAFKCDTCGFVYLGLGTQCEHDVKLKIDRYGHYYICSKCGYRDMYDQYGNINKERYGTHSYGEIIDLCNGKHSRTCVHCGYEFVSVHVYSNKVCVGCGSQNTTGIQQNIETKYEFDYLSAEQCKALQEKLKELGYYNSSVDGSIGKGTVSAINALLEHQGVSRELSLKNPKWEDITSEIYTLIMNCTEKQEDATLRIVYDNYENGLAGAEDMILLCQAKLNKLGYYTGDVDGANGPMTRKAIEEFCKLNNIDLANAEVTDELLKKILANNESVAVARDRVRKERKEEIASDVEEKGCVYFADYVYGQLYDNPKAFDYEQYGYTIPEWGEKISGKNVDCSFMGTYYAHEYAGYVADSSLEEWTATPKNSLRWKYLGQAIEEVEKIKNGEITDSKKVNNYDAENGTYIYNDEVYPVDSFEIIWSINDGTRVTDHEYKAGDIVVERERTDAGHVEVIREDGKTAVHTAGDESQWEYGGKIGKNGEYYSYTRRDDQSYVLRFKEK